MSLEQRLQECVKENPYNNFNGLFEHHGLEFPRGLGGGCIEMSRRLMATASADGIPTRVIRTENGHFALTADLEGTRYYVDPGLLQQTPIALSAIPEGGTRVASYPLGSYMDLQLSPGGKLKVVKWKPSQETCFNDTLDLDNEVELPNYEDKRVAGMWRDRVLITSIEENDEMLLLQRDIFRDRLVAQVFGGARPRRAECAPWAYSSVVSRVAERIGERASLSPMEVLGYLGQAVDLHKRIFS